MLPEQGVALVQLIKAFPRSAAFGSHQKVLAAGVRAGRWWTQFWTQTPWYGTKRDGTRSPFARS
jgi:hypothetical protein